MVDKYKISLLFDVYGGVLTKTQQELVDDYFNNDLSLGEIAANRGITRQGVRDAIKRAEGIMEDLENKLSFMSKRDKIDELLTLVRKQVVNIEDENRRTCHSPAITLIAKGIVKDIDSSENG